MPGGAQGPLGMLRASQMVQQLLPGGHMPYVPQPEEEKKPQFITELEINDFPQHARWKVSLRLSLLPAAIGISYAPHSPYHMSKHRSTFVLSFVDLLTHTSTTDASTHLLMSCSLFCSLTLSCTC